MSMCPAPYPVMLMAPDHNQIRVALSGQARDFRGGTSFPYLDIRHRLRPEFASSEILQTFGSLDNPATPLTGRIERPK